MYLPLVVVVDVDGDGRWHLLAYDLETGEHRLDLPDVYLHGHVDVDGDGCDELLTQYCPGRPVGTNGELRLYQWDKLLWGHSYARWSMTTLPQLPLTHITGATRGMEAPVAGTLEGGNRQALFFTASGENECLHALYISSAGETEIAWKVEGPVGVLLDAVAVSDSQPGEAKTYLIRARAPKDANIQLHADWARLEAVAHQRLVRGAPQPLVLHDAEKRPQIVIAEPLDGISGWVVEPEGNPPKRVVWRRDILEVKSPWTETRWPHTRGYGGGTVAIADFDGDGLDDIVLCYPAEYSIVKGNTGEQYLVEVTGPLKGTNNFWVIGGWPLVADLNDDGALETLWTSSSIIIAFAPSAGASSSHCNRRAEILWRTEPNDGTTGLPAIGDTDGDGRLEIGLPGFQDSFRCIDAATGEVIMTVPSQGSSAPNCIAVDINGDGLEEFLYANDSHLLAVARRPGIKPSIVWQIDMPASIQNIVVADVDGDGKCEILAGGSDGVLYGVE